MSSVEYSETSHGQKATAPPDQGVVTLAGLPAAAPGRDGQSPTERRRRAHRNKMRGLEKRLLELPKIRVEDEDYPKLGITVEETLSLDFDTTVEPCFFIPHPGAFPSPSDDMDKEYPVYNHKSLLPVPVVRTKDRTIGFLYYFMDYLTICQSSSIQPNHEEPWVYKDLSQYENYRASYDTRIPTWELCTVAKKAGYPHLQCMMYINVDEGDDRLLHAELLNITRLMLWSFKSDKHVDYVNTPILMLSIMGPQHARFLQAYFQEKTFVIKYSKLYNFMEQDDSALELFARWALARPTGNTKLDETQNDPEKQADTQRKGKEEL